MNAAAARMAVISCLGRIKLSKEKGRNLREIDGEEEEAFNEITGSAAGGKVRRVVWTRNKSLL